MAMTPRQEAEYALASLLFGFVLLGKPR